MQTGRRDPSTTITDTLSVHHTMRDPHDWHTRERAIQEAKHRAKREAQEWIREGQAYLATPTSDDAVRERYIERAFQCFVFADEARART